MPLYDCRAPKTHGYETPLPGSVPFPDDWHGTADANGNVLSPLLWANTETGEVGRYGVTNGVWEVDPETQRVVVKNETHPAPLRKATKKELNAAREKH